MERDHLPHDPQSLAVTADRPLVALFDADEDDAGVVRYFAEEPASPSHSPSPGARAALSVIGAWADMDWDELADSLDRIRHESRPTPPIDLGDV